MKYKFINQILDISKANIVIILKIIMITNSYQHEFKKYSILPKVK